MADSNIRVSIFENPSTAEKKRTYTNHVVLSGSELTNAGLPRRIAISTEEDLFFIPPEHDLIPGEITTRFGRRRLDRDFKKFWRYANIISLNTRATDPQANFRSRMQYILPDDYTRAYSWKSADIPRIYVPLTAILDGRRLYYAVTKLFPQLGIGDRIEVRNYGPEAVVRLPSRSMEEVKRYTIRFNNLSTQGSGEPWHRIEPHHACEDREYKLRAEGYFADDHVVAAFTAVELSRLETSDTIVRSPFLIPGRMLATFDDRLRNQVIKLYFPKGSYKPEERNLQEAERELLLWKFSSVVHAQEGQRSYQRLFTDSYSGVEDYLVPHVQI
ncbi:MAG: hypothetical protein HYT70_03520 [Candidatus Aenigmarchaeota archaeon]|nr:hypothetical protein [Candidatus Aenigmarchaeota archaeon]